MTLTMRDKWIRILAATAVGPRRLGIKLSGLAVPFGVLCAPRHVEGVGDIRIRFAPGSLVVDSKQPIRALFHHFEFVELGDDRDGTVSVRLDDRGLYATIDLPNNHGGRRAASLMRGDNAVKGFSVGVIPDKFEILELADGTPILEHRQCVVEEISVTDAPAFGAATSISVSGGRFL